MMQQCRLYELHYHLVRQFGLSFDQAINAFAKVWFEAEDRLSADDLVSKFEDPHSVNTIRSVLHRCNITRESAHAAFYRANPPVPVRFHSADSSSKTGSAPLAFRVPDPALPLDRINFAELENSLDGAHIRYVRDSDAGESRSGGNIPRPGFVQPFPAQWVPPPAAASTAEAPPRLLTPLPVTPSGPRQSTLLEFGVRSPSRPSAFGASGLSHTLAPFNEMSEEERGKVFFISFPPSSNTCFYSRS